MRKAFIPTLVLLAFLLAGCATTRKEAATPTFFPPSPDEPRIQFLFAFSSDVELGRKATFSDYVTGRPAGVDPLVKPYGMAVQNGNLYVCDTMTRGMEIFDFAKKRGRYFIPQAEGRFHTPLNVAVDKDGTRYVADTGREQVLIYKADDSYVGAIGTKDEMRPTDVLISGDRLYVSDLKGHSVRIYDKAGLKVVGSIPAGEPADVNSGKLFSPTNMAMDEQGNLVVSDIGAFVVQIFDKNGKYIRTIGRQGVAPGFFARPKGVAVDHAGRIYVVDAATQVVQLFNPEGQLLMFFGQPGASSKGDLYLPAGIELDYGLAPVFQKYAAPGFKLEYVLFVTSQFGDNKVSVYGFGSRK